MTAVYEFIRSSTGIFLTAVLFLIAVLLYLFYRIGLYIGHLQQDLKWRQSVPGIREDAIKRSRAVLAGQFSEQLAPYMPDFRYSPKDCRFLGQPVDLVVFRGMDGKNISEVVFVEIKSGTSQLSGQERNLRDAVVSGRVRYEEYRIPSDLTSLKADEQ